MGNSSGEMYVAPAGKHLIQAWVLVKLDKEVPLVSKSVGLLCSGVARAGLGQP